MLALKAIPLLSALTLVLGACAAPQADISPEGQLEIFSQNNTFVSGYLPEDWVLEGVTSQTLFSTLLEIGKLDTAPTLKIRASDQAFALVRRTNASLLASPFFAWSWRVTTPLGKRHPVRLVIGFNGGTPYGRRQRIEDFINFETGIPKHDRTVTLVWGTPEDIPGSIDVAGAAPQFIVRAGNKSAETWMTENIDLSQIYARLWPNDDMIYARIRFIGVVSGGHPVKGMAEFSDLLLYR